MNNFIDKKFSFEEVVVDAQANLIIRNGKEKRVEPKIIALLCLFARNARQVVSRQQIVDEIWPKVVVGEESITRAIYTLRNALGDDAKQPRFIETISKKGYRFLPDVTLVPEIHFKPIITVLTPKKTFYWLSLITLVVGGLFVSLIRLDASANVNVDRILPVTKMTGSEGSIAVQFSTKKIAFVHNTKEISELYVQDLISGAETLIANDNGQKQSPMWLDQNTLIYLNCNDGRCNVLRQFKNQLPEILYRSEKYIFHMSRATGSASELLLSEYQSNESIELKLFNLQTGERAALRTSHPALPAKISVAYFSDDASMLFFLANEAGKPLIYSLDLSSSKLNVINNKFDIIRNFSITRDQHLLIAGSTGDVQGLWRQDSNGNMALILRSSGDELILRGVLDENSNTIYYENFKANMDTFIKSGRSNVTLKNINSDGCDVNGIFGQSEQFIYLVSNRNGYSEIWRYDRSLAKMQQLTHLNAVLAKNPIISHDQKRLAVVFLTDRQYLGIVDLQTGELLVKKALEKDKFPLS